jgi:hypothetical protein
VLLVALVSLAAVAGAVLWAVGGGSSSAGSAGMGDAPGLAGIGSAPTGTPSGGGPLIGDPGPGAGLSAGPGGSAAPSGQAQTTASTPAGASLQATYVILPGLLWDRMDITITNSGDAEGKWGSVVVRFEGVNLIITPGPGVTYEPRGNVHTFRPENAIQTVLPGSSVSFYFTTTVGGVLGDPTGCSLDGQECKG